MNVLMYCNATLAEHMRHTTAWLDVWQQYIVWQSRAINSNKICICKHYAHTFKFRKSASWAGKKKFTNEDSSPKFASQAFRASYPKPTSGRSGEGGRGGGGQAIDIPHKNRSIYYT